MTNKAVHAKVANDIANLCALNTYIVCGEIINLHVLVSDKQSEPSPVAEDTAAQPDEAPR
ncbi:MULTISPECIES: hypothetical protein [unclassified Streptomyces]|uniref:hypothetical protein n=1 Tax=unclassified Streptomyces TaxID=2593676 RepID=UPI000A6547C7|nr:hypothetical protein [Streptomyces sp. TSRI0281]